MVCCLSNSGHTFSGAHLSLMTRNNDPHMTTHRETLAFCPCDRILKRHIFSALLLRPAAAPSHFPVMLLTAARSHILLCGFNRVGFLFLWGGGGVKKAQAKNEETLSKHKNNTYRTKTAKSRSGGVTSVAWDFGGNTYVILQWRREGVRQQDLEETDEGRERAVSTLLMTFPSSPLCSHPFLPLSFHPSTLSLPASSYGWPTP